MGALFPAQHAFPKLRVALLGRRQEPDRAAPRGQQSGAEARPGVGAPDPSEQRRPNLS